MTAAERVVVDRYLYLVRKLGTYLGCRLLSTSLAFYLLGTVPLHSTKNIVHLSAAACAAAVSAANAKSS